MKVFTSIQTVTVLSLAALLTQLGSAQPAGVPILPALPDNAPSLSWVPRLSSGSGGGGGGNPAAKPAPNPPPSTNIVATFSGAPYNLGVARTSATTFHQAEEHIAVDPNNSTTLVAAISDFSSTRVINGGTGYNTTKYAVSRDNGNSWREYFVPLDANGFPITSDGRSWEANSDPVLAIDNQGRVYMADLYFNATDNANGFYVNVGDLSSGTFGVGLPVATNYDPNTANFEDKPWIAVDTSRQAFDGRVYVSWTRFSSSGSDIYFSSSSNQGATWTVPLLLSPAAQSGHLQGSQVAVGPNGAVYVAWWGGTANNSGVYQYQQFLVKSTDGGQTFSTAKAISPIINSPSFSSSYRKNPFPALGVDPRPGFANLYVAWADQPDSTLGSEVKFIASHDGGTNFSSPVIINDKSTNQQFMPALTVDGQGRVHCSWFDTRNSPDGTAGYYDIYATYTADGGTSFATNARVTSATITAHSFIGDYAGIAAAGGYAHPVWTAVQLATATLLLPGTSDFSLSASPALQYARPYQGTNFTVNVTGYGGFSGAVSLSVSGLPDGTWGFGAFDNGSSTLTVNGSTGPGTYDLIIAGTSGTMVRTAEVTLNVQDPDFTLSVAPASATVPSVGGTANYTLSIGQILGFSGTVDLAIDGLPAGASFTPQQTNAPSTSTLAVSVPQTAAGTYPLTITGTSSTDPSLTHTASTTLLVLSAPTAVYVARPSGTDGYSVSGGKNNNANLTVQVLLTNNFANPVSSASVSTTLYLNGAAYGSASATTDANGTASFVARNAPAGTYATKVTSVSAPGLTWDGKTPANSFIKK